MQSLFIKKISLIFDFLSIAFYFVLGFLILLNHPFLAMQLDYFIFFTPYILQNFINFINF
jgi:hypothetical protein